MKTLRYKRHAKKWIDALPLGNGLMGAMVYGGIKKERIAFNNSSLWSGRPKKHDNEESLKHLEEVRELIFKGENHLADKLCEETDWEQFSSKEDIIEFYSENSNLLDTIVDNDKLGRTIFEQMTPGIHTNECAGDGLNYGVSGEYNYALYPNFTKSIYWKICKPYLSDATTRYFTIKIVQLNNYKGDNIEPVEIAKAIGNYMNKLKIAQCFNTYADIVPLVINAGLNAFGEQTYYCVSDSVVFRHNSLDITGNVNNFGCTYFSFQGIVLLLSSLPYCLPLLYLCSTQC